MDLPLLSATQIQLFEDCQRKWAFKYLERLETPKHPGALLGTEVQDTQLDPWLAEGRTFDFTRPSGEIAAKLAPLLPPPRSPGMRLRRKFLMPSPTGAFAYQGEMDLWASDSGIVPGLAGGRPLLGDIKTTSNLIYAKTAEALATDIQAQLYATNVLVEDFADGAPKEVDIVWFYTKTRKAYRAQRVHLRVADNPAQDGVPTVTTRHVVEQFQRIDSIGAQLVAIRKANPKTNELPPSPRMCDEYGGCPFRFQCNLAPPVFAEAVNKEACAVNDQTIDWLQSLRKPSTTATPSSVAAPAPAALSQTGVYVTPPPASASAAVVNTSAAAEAAGLPAFLAKPVEFQHTVPPAINPPESKLPSAPPVGAVAPAVEAEEKPKAKRGRSAGSKNAVVSADDVGIGLAAIVEALAFPKVEFAAFLRAWAAKVEGGS